MKLHDPATCDVCARFRAYVEAGEIVVICDHADLAPDERCDLCSRVKA